MTKPLKNRVMLVTGAARGIGAATAIALGRAGTHVLALGRTAASLKATEDTILRESGAVTSIALDVTDYEGVMRLAETVEADFGRLDGLVGNAAVLGPRIPLNQLDPANWNEAMAVNVTANWFLIRSFDRLLRQSDAARVVFVTAGSVSNPKPNGSIYTITKAALEGLARIYAQETEDTPMRVNLFNPGPIRTTMRAMVAPDEDPMILDTPEQAAERIVALCLPSVTETGMLYDYPAKAMRRFRGPA